MITKNKTDWKKHLDEIRNKIKSLDFRNPTQMMKVCAITLGVLLIARVLSQLLLPLVFGLLIIYLLWWYIIKRRQEKDEKDQEDDKEGNNSNDN